MLHTNILENGFATLTMYGSGTSLWNKSATAAQRAAKREAASSTNILTPIGFSRASVGMPGGRVFNGVGVSYARGRVMGVPTF